MSEERTGLPQGTAHGLIVHVRLVLVFAPQL